MVLEDVTEQYAMDLIAVPRSDNVRSDYTGANTQLAKILLNGNNICMVRPGSDMPLAAVTGTVFAFASFSLSHSLQCLAFADEPSHSSFLAACPMNEWEVCSLSRRRIASQGSRYDQYDRSLDNALICWLDR